MKKYQFASFVLILGFIGMVIIRGLFEKSEFYLPLEVAMGSMMGISLIACVLDKK